MSREAQIDRLQMEGIPAVRLSEMSGERLQRLYNAVDPSGIGDVYDDVTGNGQGGMPQQQENVVRRYYQQNAQAFAEMNTSEDDLLDGYRSMSSRNPKLTGAQYLSHAY